MMSPEGQAPVSAIITAYNCAAYLRQAIESALGQTRPAQQVIVVDDGSTDGCAEVAVTFGACVQYHYQPNRGSGAARNAGIRLATGEWLALLDGDDYWEQDKLDRQLTAIGADTSLDIVFGYMQQFASPDLDPEERARLRVPPEPMPGVCASTILVRRGSFQRIGEFVEGLHISEFIDWYGRAVEAGLRVALVPETVAWRRVHANNTSRLHMAYRLEYARVLKTMLDRRRAADQR